MRFDAARIHATVSALGFPRGSALIHAGAALVLHGLQDSAADIDIATSTEGWRHALTLGVARQASLDQRVEPCAGVEVFSGWLGDDVAELFARAQLKGGLLVAAPVDILAFKRRLNRPKDQAHIRMLESFLQ